ncbi:MAG: tRNA (guanosine(46)-N7)-methyltransferase TrmB [Alphaproteobacteria bacterium]
MRSGLKALLRDLLPRLSVALPPVGGMLDTGGLFPPQADGSARPVWLEIGFGAGEHLAWQARTHPDVGMLGAEFFVNGIAQLLRRVDNEDLAAVRIFQGDARDLLEVLPAASIDRVFVLFPDPWPKVRHHKRRLIQPDTLAQLARITRDGAQLCLATDDMPYARWMLEQLTGHSDFAWLAEGPGDWRQRPGDWPPTRYEAKAEASGHRPVYLRFARRPRPV